MERTNALAELAKRLRNGLYINPNDKRFDGPVIVRSLDAKDVLAAQRIIAKLATEWEPIDRSKVEKGADGMVHLADIVKAGDKRRCEILIACMEIAEEGLE